MIQMYREGRSKREREKRDTTTTTTNDIRQIGPKTKGRH